MEFKNFKLKMEAAQMDVRSINLLNSFTTPWQMDIVVIFMKIP